MIGVRGRLISATFAETVLPTLHGVRDPDAPFHDALDAWAERCERSIGPASGARAIADVVVVPLLRLLGFEPMRRRDEPEQVVLDASAESATVPVLAVPWGHPLDTAWRALVLTGVRADRRWCLSCNGLTLRIVDAGRAWSRHYLEFDLALLAREPGAKWLLWNIVRAGSYARSPPLLDEAADRSATLGTVICGALGRGVLEALRSIFTAIAKRRHAGDTAVLFDQSVTVLYRVLFLLFAEARGLVPVWHPVYRDRYSLDGIVQALLTGRRARGIWHALHAISRLAHGGCAAGPLRVTAFNGRLFSPAGAELVERANLDDSVIGAALIAVGTTSIDGRSRQRIAYRDLDVEQLGAVYERVLEHQPGPAGTDRLDRNRDARKATSTFYTPRAITAHLVERTLEPLVRGRSADEVLGLRVLDPAMGSGAFLVAACRYLASAVEDALIREGRWHPGQVSATDRAMLRREVAQRCLFGVDLNPMAVQLARLSLWLATLAADRPLTFLDHHLVVGDSLVGASIDDLRRQPPRTGRPMRRQKPLPLFEAHGFEGTVQHAVRTRLELTGQADSSADVVRAKERSLAALHRPGSDLDRLRRVLDLWCAAWFWQQGQPPNEGTFAALSAALLHGRHDLPPAVAGPLLDQAGALATQLKFLHWTVTFPEVFADADGRPSVCPGFDAVLGNPPWDMVRGDSGSDTARTAGRNHARRLTSFVRESGIYQVDAGAHLNRYQLFVERTLQLVKPGGRIGLVLPAGAATDAGAAGLRRHLFARTAVDTLTGLDNRGGIFPIHRSVRFVLLTCTTGESTFQVACRFGISVPEQLFHADAGSPLVITTRLLRRISGDEDLGIPEVASSRDLAILEAVAARHPLLGSGDGWHARFGRELNASDDRHRLVPFTGDPDARPVLEGKHVDPFRARLGDCRFQLADDSRVRVPWRPRLVYRDIASATNRLTLIAAVAPARAATTHTLFCLKTPLPLLQQHALAALMNSLVANYLIRMRVNTHVTVALVSRLPVPWRPPDSPVMRRIGELARELARGTGAVERDDRYVELQARSARLYGVRADDLEHVLATFPLIAADVRQAIRSRFEELPTWP